MKNTRKILLVLALILDLAALTCVILAYLDQIAEGLDCLRGKLREKGCCLCRCRADGCSADEDEDFEDWDL